MGVGDGDEASDEMENRLAGSIELDELDQFRHKPLNGTVRDFWINGYKGISNANFAIAGIQDMKMDEKLKSRLIGEARFLRGLLYFDLVRLFGDIPLMLSITDPVYPKKALNTAIYEQIILDLSFAEKNLPTSYPANNGKGRATSGAAKGLLAKVFLTQKNYAKAISYCKDIISSGQYSLWADFKDAFKIPNTNGKEALFSVGFGTGNNSISFWEVGQFNVRLLPKELTESVANINAQGWQVATKSLLNAYDPLDRRQLRLAAQLQLQPRPPALPAAFVRPGRAIRCRPTSSCQRCTEPGAIVPAGPVAGLPQHTQPPPGLAVAPHIADLGRHGAGQCGACCHLGRHLAAHGIRAAAAGVQRARAAAQRCGDRARPRRGRAGAGGARGHCGQLAQAARGLPAGDGALPRLWPAPDVPGPAPA